MWIFTLILEHFRDIIHQDVHKFSQLPSVRLEWNNRIEATRQSQLVLPSLR